jgi:hypothetical protein
VQLLERNGKGSREIWELVRKVLLIGLPIGKSKEDKKTNFEKKTNRQEDIGGIVGKTKRFGKGLLFSMECF